LPEASPDDGKVAGKGNAQQLGRTGPPGTTVRVCDLGAG
jgi:hypothetical protein